MKKFKIITALFLSVIVFTVTSCENEALDGDFSNGNSENSGNDNGNGNDGNTDGTTSGDYWPMAVGNIWTYNFFTDGEAQDDSEMEMETLENYQGEPSYKMSSFMSNATATDGTSGANVNLTTYARKNNGDYSIFVASTSLEIQGTYQVNQSAYDYITLKDYLETGQTWDTNYSIVSTYTPLMAGIPDIPDSSIDVTATFEILERDASVSVNGEMYSPVIKVKQFNTYSLVGAPDSTAEIIMYFAKDVGLIKSFTTSFDGDDNITAESETLLSSYVLN